MKHNQQSNKIEKEQCIRKQKKIKNRDKITAVNNAFRSLRFQSYYEQQQRDHLEKLKTLFNKICECMYYLNREIGKENQ